MTDAQINVNDFPNKTYGTTLLVGCVLNEYYYLNEFVT